MDDSMKIKIAVSGKVVFCQTLECGTYIVGRSIEAVKDDASLNDAGEHQPPENALLRVSPDGVALERLPGTIASVDGEELRLPVRLTCGMKVKLGKCVVLSGEEADGTTVMGTTRSADGEKLPERETRYMAGRTDVVSKTWSENDQVADDQRTRIMRSEKMPTGKGGAAVMSTAVHQPESKETDALHDGTPQVGDQTVVMSAAVEQSGGHWSSNESRTVVIAAADAQPDGQRTGVLPGGRLPAEEVRTTVMAVEGRCPETPMSDMQGEKKSDVPPSDATRKLDKTVIQKRIDVPADSQTPKDGTERLDPEEIKRRKSLAWQQNRRRHILYGGCFIALLVLSFLVLLSRQRVADPMLGFRLKEDGTADMKILEIPYQGIAFSYPVSDSMTIKELEGTPSGYSVQTYVGKEEQVPLRLFWYTWRERFVLELDREELFEYLIRKLEDGSTWIPKEISPLTYLGNENGLPTLERLYERESDGSKWYGKARLLRKGDRAYIFMAEVPLDEKLRALFVIDSYSYIKLTQDFVTRHWEKQGVLATGETDALVRKVEDILSREQATAWKDAHLYLRTLLVRASLEVMQYREKGDQEKKNMAQDTLSRHEDMLVRLRRQEEKWYNKQRFSYDNVQIRKSGDAGEIMENAETMFPSAEDQRRVLLTRKMWEW